MLRKYKSAIKATWGSHRFEHMIIETETAPFVDNMLAKIFSWLLLAGYLVFPGTFTSIRDSKALEAATNENVVSRFIYRSVQNAPLLGLAGLSCAVGATGAVWLWRRWRHNYVWITRQIFLYFTVFFHLVSIGLIGSLGLS